MKPDDPRHGTVNGYNNLGCRCVPCTAAGTAYYAPRVAKWRVETGNAEKRRRRYEAARAAGYSAKESKRRSFWLDPLRVEVTS